MSESSIPWIIAILITIVGYIFIDQDTKRSIAAMAQANALKQKRLHDMDTLSLNAFASKIMQIWEKRNGKIEKLAVINGRVIFQVTDGTNRYICIVYKTYEPIGISEIRGLYAMVTEKGYASGYYYTNETFSHPAIHYANEKSLHLINQNDLDNLAISNQIDWLAKAEEPTPEPKQKLCPVCNQPMLIRKATKGPDVGKDFYVCPNYRSCKQAYPVGE